MEISKEKQIEEIAEQIQYTTGSYRSDAESCAEILYEQMNYRRQSEGKWIKKEYDIDGEITIGIVCNRCGANQVAGLGLAKYCYMCGAKMKGGAE